MGEVIQVAIAIGMGIAILGVGRWGIRLLATPGPEEPDPEDIVEVSVPFRCTVCGLQLTVTHAQDEELAAPRHCREEMEPV